VAASQNHYFRDGTKTSGAYHKMPNGELHSGAKHTKGSKKLYHYRDLPSAVAKTTARKKKKA